jgi:hypothetical protein
MDKINQLLKHPTSRHDQHNGNHHQLRNKGHGLLVDGGGRLYDGNKQADQYADKQNRRSDFQPRHNCISEDFRQLHRVQCDSSFLSYKS